MAETETLRRLMSQTEELQQGIETLHRDTDI